MAPSSASRPRAALERALDVPSGVTPPDRICASCGRAFSWRKAWARDWDQVRYCSGACRKRGVNATDAALETAIVELSPSGPVARPCAHRRQRNGWVATTGNH